MEKPASAEKPVSCGCGKAPVIALQSPARHRAPYVTGYVTAGNRKIPRVSTSLSRADRLGGWKVRWDIGRMSYTILPGLYAVGSPSADSPVLVTANYKLTFDRLRSQLGGIDAWILVLDTKGINVWCAAGKGTFGTAELIARAAAVKLEEVVSHRRLILPQLGATGVSAPVVRQQSGWQVKYGPVEARDIPAFLSGGSKKDAAMRTVQFRLPDRMVIAPAELAHSWPILLGAVAVSGLLAIPFDTGYVVRALSLFLPLVGATLLGTMVVPALLPFLPFRAFALKGALLGALWGIAASFAVHASAAGAAALILLSMPVVSFLSMNFTGSSTFTCQPGAALEVKRGFIPMISSLVLGLGAGVVARVLPL
ncbi:MAG: mercury methylation corrinoid protein HgcA [Spirochaetia bacterium]